MINIALLGYGRIGKKYLSYSRKIKQILINKVLKTKKVTSVPKISVFTSYQKLIKSNNIDAFIIASPVDTHYYYAKKILKLKKPFIIEKPIVKNFSETSKLLNITKNYKKNILVNYTDLHNPAFTKFMKSIKTIGTFKKINISFGKKHRVIRGKYNPSFDWLPHPIAIAIKIAGYPSKIKILKNNFFLKNKFLIQNCKIKFEYKKFHIIIDFSNNFSIARRRVKINGSKSTIIYDGYKKNMLLKKTKKDKFYKKIYYKKLHPIQNLLNKFYLNIKSKSIHNDMLFSHQVMKILIFIERQINNR